MSFVSRLKQETTGDRNARYVFLGNFEVETDWAQGEPRLPGAGVNFTAATVNRMEEMGVFLAEPGDILVLKQPLDPGYRAYLDRLGVPRATVLCPENSDPVRRITDDVLASPDLLAELRSLADGRTFLMPVGVSDRVQDVADRTGLPIAGSDSAACKTVNSKIFSRRLVERTGLLPVPGQCCDTYAELSDALGRRLATGERVVVKEAFGVSGRGMVVLDGQGFANAFARMVVRRGGETRADMVVETWIDKAEDLNYQFIVTVDGGVHFETVKGAVTKSGVHRGHRFPVRLPEGTRIAIRRAAELIGRELHRHGYHGMVGVDAMLAKDGTLYPCLEINARLNMANYQSAIADLCVPDGSYAQACSLDVTLAAPVTFADLVAPLSDLLLDTGPSPRRGVLVTNFATVNASHDTTDGPFRGRLGAMCVAPTATEAEELYRELSERLGARPLEATEVYR